MEEVVNRNIQEWLRLDTNPESHASILELKTRLADPIHKSKAIELFGEQISFGTAGLRAKIGSGFSRMNEITVQLTTQGIAEYLLREKDASQLSVIVGHDHRHGSESFAMTTARTFAVKGIKVFLVKRIIPTPYVSFGVNLLRASFGVMITASHNPKDDNGYKVYGPSSAQINSPTDKHIAALIQTKNRQLWELGDKLDFEDPFDAIHAAYLGHIAGDSSAVKLPDTIPKVVYTPMHGVGQWFQEELLKKAGIPPLIPVPEQQNPDPDFPTVVFPNPEEGAGSLSLAFKTAEHSHSSVVFANDPDADRFNFSERQPDGTWYIFNGNEIALLLADFIWRNRGSHPSTKKFAVVTSLVSSEMLGWMAKKEGFHFEKVDTGFKNLAAAAQRLTSEGYSVLLTYEEAIGYMIGTAVWDKDGLSALLTAYRLVIDLSQKGKSIKTRLVELFDLYGHQVQYNSYYVCAKPKEAFKRLRDRIHANEAFSNAKISPGLVYLELDDDAWLAFRPSGTEPKLKFYSEMKSTAEGSVVPQERLQQLVLKVCDTLLEPQKNGIATVAVVPERYEALQDWLEVQDAAIILDDDLDLSIGDTSLSFSDQASIADEQVIFSSSDDSLEDEPEPIHFKGSTKYAKIIALLDWQLI